MVRLVSRCFSLTTSLTASVQSSLIWALVALFFPPLPVAIRKGCSGHLVLNIVLLILAWIPAVLHAWYVILEYDSDGQKKVDRKIRKARDAERVGALKQEAAEKEKIPVGNGMGNQQGWHGPQPTRTLPQTQAQETSSQPLPQQRQEVPEYARDMKQG